MARVVFVVTTSYPREDGDASGHFVETEAVLRAKAGDSVTVLAPGRGPRERRGVSIHWLPGGDAFGPPGALARIRARPRRIVHASAFVLAANCVLANRAIDEVVAHWLVPCAWPIAMTCTGALEIVCHGSDVRLLLALPPGVRLKLLHELLERGARFRFVSRDLRDRLARSTTEAILDRSRVEPCAIDVTGVPAKANARRALGLKDGERVAVVVGRLIDSKRPLDAVRLAFENGADRVVVIGAGPLCCTMEHDAPRATLLGNLPRPATLAWLAAADVLVNASGDEGAPTVIREARALGTKVTTVPCGDVRDWAELDPGIALVST